MSTSEFETLIRNILSEQLAPVKAEAQGNGIFPSVDEAIDTVHQAFLRYQQCPLKIRSAIINALCEELTSHLASLAAESAAEMGMDSKEDKFLKNKAALSNTPDIGDLTTTTLTGDDGMVLFEYSPFGVVDSVVPGTDPTETTINSNVSVLATGGGVYLSPHLDAKKISLKLIAMIGDIALRCCGIRNLVIAVTESTLEATQQMMAHPETAVLAITGGPGITVMDMKSGKKVTGVDAGNPPYVVDEITDLVKAAEDIINGVSFDCNLPCITEKSLIVAGAVAKRPVQQMQSFGVMLLDSEEVDELRAVYLPEGITNKKLVGKSPVTLLKAAGMPVPAKAPQLLTGIAKADDPQVTSEQLVPMFPAVTVGDFDSALALTLEVEEGLHHTAIVYSQNVSRSDPAVRTLQTSIFAKNGPPYTGIGAGDEGLTTFIIVTPTGEGVTSARTFAHSRRCVLTNGFSIR